MKRILLRAGKGPFDVVSPEASLVHNKLATNAGNLVFSHAAYKLLATPDTEVVPNQHRIDASDAGRINERFDHFVVPLANAIRPGFESHLRALTALIEKLTIPVTVFGVGAQASLSYDTSRLRKLEDVARRFARAVLDHSPSIGVRGELTERYFRDLGFTDIDVIGCPSMFMHGDRLNVEKKLPELDENARIAISASPNRTIVDTIGPIIAAHHKKYPNLVYVAQNNTSLELLLWGDTVSNLGKFSEKPVYDTHPLYREGKMRMFVDPWPWIDFLAQQDFVFGTRIHGNIAALIAGTPSFVLAHDSRTLELCRYFDIPHRKITDVRPDVDARELYDEADYTALQNGHRERYDTMLAYMDRHGLECSFVAGGAEEFDQRLQELTFPPAVEPLSAENARTRLRALREETAHLRRSVVRLEASRAELHRSLAGLAARLDRVERRTSLTGRVGRLLRKPAVPPAR